MAVKYSRQRQVIYNFLMSRKDHPTADVVYQNVRQEYPNISLGTVYRNLTLLTDRGEIQRLQVGDGVDRFDADTSRHCHFVCSGCGCVTDLPLDCMEDMLADARKKFDGRIDRQSTYFYGLCRDCLNHSADISERDA
ncbi:MAG: transcriptional repressor [Lachnospiraceae bacterium]|nr:transcriptional repressor [Lachnospiraceae bacterium]MDE7359919.1 transcriptional repressor [Lachnospiraceae bacterium]